MKFIVTAAALLMILTVGCSTQQNSPPAPAKAGERSAAPSEIGVDELMKNVDKYSGDVTVLGVVKAMSESDGRLSLIDHEEYKRCRVVTCSLLTLPVKWSGEMPSIMDVVRMSGHVEEEGEKLVFTANSLEKTEP